ncbi:Rieske (2Fe-2S) protein [Salegentibacter sp. JZCK2]|uniref:QcrA and Rieske domain-containing protein n=1 Tax=Salegentibacter tibetensis TaxID=2873600 RepID=UPI001CCE3BB8|nr:Rieske (2Fe-2S) protein [Salegentibacter tibetensis]MBZ9731544.1 Rieske (2Fe-2S) protein [Salegentibacter tibetensis]
MKRVQFIKSVGKGVVFVCAGSCMMSACSTSDDEAPINGNNNPPPTSGTRVSVNLSSIPNVGDQTTKSRILFIRVGAGNSSSDFIATEAICPHQGGNLAWINNEEIIECQLHFAQYEPDGDVIRGPQNSSGNTRDLQIYSTTIANGEITATVA